LLKNITNLLKKSNWSIYIQDTIQVDEFWHNVCSELTNILAIQKQPTNRPQLNKSDRPQMNIWDTWKTLKYLNINDSIHLKDLDISKYKRELKARMPEKNVLIVAYLAFWTLKREKYKMKTLLQIEMYSVREYFPTCKFLKIIKSTLMGLVDYF
jgi:hypothetical protein